MDSNKLSELENKIEIRFKDINKLSQALTHRSYLNENKSNNESNERYEFLGDAILELWISDTLFKMFPKFDEGDLTNLRSLVVCTQNLAKIASEFDLGKYVLLSKGEENHGGRTNTSILADTFEAITGAIYLDQGIEKTNFFLKSFLDKSIEELSKQKVYKDPKSIFQEIAQAKEGITPHYKTLEETGPDHKKTFKVAVLIGDRLIATGSGNSKQRAEEDASIKATKIFTDLV
jgi:ribonuclease III